jgi:predicted Zn-dependent protease
MFINWLNDVVAERAFSRKLEEEADSVGLDIMAMAGYDPRAMADLWELMSCVEHDAEANGTAQTLDSRVRFLRSHPTSADRLDVSLHCEA